VLGTLGLGGGLALLSAFVAWQARQRHAHPPTQPADVALILGNRTHTDGAFNPNLAGRVARGLELACCGQVQQLAMTGGAVRKDGHVEAEVMAMLAREAGYAGALLQEARASSTKENLALSWPLLQAAGVRRVIVVSDAFHLWRVRRLAAASGFDRAFEVQYAASVGAGADARKPLARWLRALREPLAIVNNALHGDLY